MDIFTLSTKIFIGPTAGGAKIYGLGRAVSSVRIEGQLLGWGSGSFPLKPVELESLDTYGANRNRQLVHGCEIGT